MSDARWLLRVGEITEHLRPVEERCTPCSTARQALCVTKILRGSGGRSRTRVPGFKGPRPAVERHLIKRVGEQVGGRFAYPPARALVALPRRVCTLQVGGWFAYPPARVTQHARRVSPRTPRYQVGDRCAHLRSGSKHLVFVAQEQVSTNVWWALCGTSCWNRTNVRAV